MQELKLSPSASKNHSWIKWLELMNYYDVISVAKINSALSSTGQMPMSNVEAEYHGLRALSGWDSPRHPLKGINWDTDYVFEHGNRSPPWRQAHSELGYLEVRLHDREKLVITAAKNGLFVNKGFAKNEKGEISISNPFVLTLGRRRSSAVRSGHTKSSVPIIIGSFVFAISSLHRGVFKV